MPSARRWSSLMPTPCLSAPGGAVRRREALWSLDVHEASTSISTGTVPPRAVRAGRSSSPAATGRPQPAGAADGGTGDWFCLCLAPASPGIGTASTQLDVFADRPCSCRATAAAVCSRPVEAKQQLRRTQM